MIIQTSDLYTVIYREVIEEITRNDSDVVDNAIRNAIDEVKLYVTRYDLDALFGVGDAGPYVESSILKKFCVNIAAWNLIGLSNPNINYEHVQELYKSTIRQLEGIRDQKTQPAGWPYRETTGQTAPQGSSVYSNSYPKRKNNF